MLLNYLISKPFNTLSTQWLVNVLISLFMASIYFVLMHVINPYNNAYFILYTHLSIFVCFTSSAAVMWHHDIKHVNFCARTALVGIIMIIVSPVLGSNIVVMNQYVPILDNILFILGISLFFASLLISAFIVIYYRFTITSLARTNAIMDVIAKSLVVILIIFCICLMLSYRDVQKLITLLPIDLHFYYELLFRSGYYLLQFLYVHILISIWIILCQQFTRQTHLIKYYAMILYLNMFFAISGLYVYILYDNTDERLYEVLLIYRCNIIHIAPIMTILLMVYEIITLNRRLYLKNQLLSIFVINNQTRPSVSYSLMIYTIMCSVLLYICSGSNHSICITIAIVGMIYYIMNINTYFKLFGIYQILIFTITWIILRCFVQLIV